MKVFIIDHGNNYRVSGYFDTKKEAVEYLREKYRRGEGGDGPSFADYLETFGFLPLKRAALYLKRGSDWHIIGQITRNPDYFKELKKFI